MLRILTFFKRAPMSVFRFVFSKKFLKGFVVLIAALSLVVWLTHVLYNRYAWKHWDEVNAQYSAEYRLDEPNRFYSVSAELDFFEDAFVKEYFAREDEERLDRLSRMKLGEEDGKISFYRNNKDIRKWFLGKEFDTKKEAAVELLKLIEPFAEDANSFSRILQEKPTTTCASATELTTDDSFTTKVQKPMRLMGLVSFFSSRAKLHLLNDDSDEAYNDLNTCAQLSQVTDNDHSLPAILVRWALAAEIRSCVSYGISRNQWSSAQLDGISEYLATIHLLEDFKEFPMNEFVYNKRFVEASRKNGFGEIIDDSEDGIDALRESILGFKPEESYVDIFLEFCVSAIVPEGVLVESNTLMCEFMHDELIPILEKDVHISVWREVSGLHQSNAPWYLTWSNTSWPMLVQYKKLLRSIAEQRMTIIACELERHYLQNQKYPITLADLDALEGVNLSDPYSLGEFYYEAKDGGSFELYSVGKSFEDLNDYERRDFSEEKQRLLFFDGNEAWLVQDHDSSSDSNK